MTLITDREQFKQFKSILPTLKSDEVWFVSLSARNKYLTPEERQHFGILRTEMFAHHIFRDIDTFEYTLDKLEATLEVKRTRNNQTISRKAMVVYFNINPSSAVKAYLLFQKEMNEMLGDYVSSSLKDKQANLEGFRFADRKLLNCFQKSTGSRHFLDIDIDGEREALDILVGELRKFNIEYYPIKTKSGFHLLVKRNDLNKSGCRLHEVVQKLDKECSEVMFNKNGMLPVPGTLQAEELVQILPSS